MDINKFQDDTNIGYQKIKISGVYCMLKKKRDGKYMFTCRMYDLFTELRALSAGEAFQEIRETINYYKNNEKRKKKMGIFNKK